MNAERRIQCLVAGDANLDLLLEGEDPPIPCTEVLAKRMQLVLGGSSSITASNTRIARRSYSLRRRRRR